MVWKSNFWRKQIRHDISQIKTTWNNSGASTINFWAESIHNCLCLYFTMYYIQSKQTKSWNTINANTFSKDSCNFCWERKAIVVVKLVSKWYERDSIELTLSINQICIVVWNKEQKRVKTWKVGGQAKPLAIKGGTLFPFDRR